MQKKHAAKTTKAIYIAILVLSALTAGGFLALCLYQPGSRPAASEQAVAAAPPDQPSGSELAPPALQEAPLTSAEPPEEPEPEPEPEPYAIRLMAVGDDLIHMGVVYTGQQPDGSFDYTCLYRGISDFLDQADIKIINQETILGGNELGFSGFPYFNSPTEVGDGIAASGFNVVLQASNHSADQGLKGMENCISFWKGHPDVLMVGIHQKQEPDAARDIPLLTVEGVKFAILNYTYGPNMEVLPSDIQGRLNMLCAYDEASGRIDFTTLNPRVLEDISAAREIADVVIVCPHWGTEYSVSPSQYQKTFALEMTEAGADLILGAHPHVIEPVEWITAENGHRALCFYSLGNYVSTQKEPICMLEAMAWVTFNVTADGVSISEESTGAIPLVCQYTSGPVRIENVYPLETYTAQQADAHGIRHYGEAPLTLEALQQWRDEILGDFVLPLADALPAAADPMPIPDISDLQ